MHKNATDKNKSIPTIPAGVWESTRPKVKSNAGKSSNKTDTQGNGYQKSLPYR